MVIRKSTTHVYYPLPPNGSHLLYGSGRIRHVRGFLVVHPKSPTESSAVSRPSSRGGAI